MKIKALLSSILVMALCLTVIAGSTFALFTDSKELNIAVTSGNVEVDAAFSLVKTYSAVKADSAATKYLVDENEKTYEHVAQPDYQFSNGGAAWIDDGKLVIDKITPGDKVEAKINVKNVGDVAMIYRYIIEVDGDAGYNNKLASGMVITADGKQYEKTEKYTSEWSGKIDAYGDNKTKGIDHIFALELPVFAGNQYQSEEGDNKEVAYKVTVEAVQANADMSTDTNYVPMPVINVTNRNELQLALDNNYTAGTEYEINVLGDIIGNVTVVQRDNVKYTIYGNGYKFDGKLNVDGQSARFPNTALTVKDFNFESANVTGEFILGSYRYTNNVTIERCTFNDLSYDPNSNKEQSVACIRTTTGGDWNLTVKDCVAMASTHSLLQVKNIEKGLTITGCEVYSKNGININSTPYFNIDDCMFDVKGYAIRIGQDTPNPAKEQKQFNISNTTLKNTYTSADPADAIIMLRGDGVWCIIDLENVTFPTENVIPMIKGATEQTTVQ